MELRGMGKRQMQHDDALKLRSRWVQMVTDLEEQRKLKLQCPRKGVSIKFLPQITRKAGKVVTTNL